VAGAERRPIGRGEWQGGEPKKRGFAMINGDSAALTSCVCRLEPVRRDGFRYPYPLKNVNIDICIRICFI
jgi:hypothetical protein